MLTFFVALFVALTSAQRHGNLVHWVLEFNGTCSESSPNSLVCQAKAGSESFYANINPDYGVEFGVSGYFLGPIAYMTTTQYFDPNDRAVFNAFGEITFASGGNNDPHTTIVYTYTQDQVQYMHQQNGDHFIEAGRYDITGGTGAYLDGLGFLSVNVHGETNQGPGHESMWLSYVEGNFAVNNQQ